jgi:hypothetical protein
MGSACAKLLEQPQEQFVWNVLLAGFAIYWRNTQKFLNGDDDQESIKAKKYVKRFVPSSAEDLKDEIELLHYHVLHLSGKRTSDDEKKFALEDVRTLMTWLQSNIDEFVEELPEPYKSQWKSPSGPQGPSGDQGPTTGPTGPAPPPSATNAVRIVQSTHSTLVQSFNWKSGQK